MVADGREGDGETWQRGKMGERREEQRRAMVGLELDFYLRAPAELFPRPITLPKQEHLPGLEPRLSNCPLLLLARVFCFRV